jgi:hypothetical protein
MMEPVKAVRTTENLAEGDAVRHLIETARHFFDCRERALAHARWSDPPPVRTLAEAIERDFAGFEVERAEAEFRAALAALCNDPADAAPRAAAGTLHG